MSIVKKDVYLVLTQFLLMAAYLLPINMGHFERFQFIGGIFVLTGSMIGVAAIWQLRHAISPFPSPKAGALLIDTGVFRWIRHPIYTGILAVTLGYTLYSGSIWRGMITLCLLILFQFKARYEERLLEARFDQYKDYMYKTGRFLPKVGK